MYKLIFILLSCLSSIYSQNLELKSDVVIFKITPWKGNVAYAQVGSLRLAQKLNLKIGDIIIKGQAWDVFQKSIDVLSGGGKIFIKRGDYRLGKALEIPLPSQFIIEGEQNRCSPVNIIFTHRDESIKFIRKSENFAKNSYLQLRNISFTNYSGKYVLKISSIPCLLTGLVITGSRFKEKRQKSLLLLKDCKGMNLVEHCTTFGRYNEYSLNFDSKFVTAISNEAFAGGLISNYLFGPGNLLLGGHTATGSKHATRTHPMKPKERKFYPTTLFLAPEGYGIHYFADGACLILVECSKSWGATITYKEENGGKIIIIGEEHVEP